MQRIWLTILALFLIITSALTFYKLHRSTQQYNNLSQNPETALLAQAAVWYPSAPWSSPKANTQTTLYGTFTGESISAVIKSDTVTTEHFEDTNALKKMGFLPDTNLAADGPGSSVWGYSKFTDNLRELIIFSYQTKPTNTNPNEPVQFICPCSKTIAVFASVQPAPSTTLANPASVNCTQKGGTLLIKKRGDGGEYGLCDFGDNMQCEEWALYRGDCPVGGRKTTGYDTIQEKYCAWLGGSTYAVENAQCTLPNGHTCSDTALYNGACQ